MKTNYNTNNNYNTYQNNIQINQNSSQYYSQNNKYLITFNSNPRKLELEGKRSSDGVLRGYTNNCSFYVSGSSDLNSTLNDKNKAHKNKEKNHYENKTFENTISHSKNNTNKTNNIKINNNYNITKYENNKLKNKDIKNNNYIKINTNLTNKNINNYKIPISSTNSKEQKPKINYAQTEPSNNVIYFSQNTSSNSTSKYTSNYDKGKNITNNKSNCCVNYYIPNINNLYNNNQKRVYKTSTNTNYNDISRKNYFLTETEPKPSQTKRNNTPSALRLGDKYISSKEEKRINYYKININNDEKNKGRHHISEIPHNYIRERNIYNLDKNSINNTTKNPQTKYTFNKPNSNSNSNLNTKYIRYNKFDIKPGERKYGTRTETYSFDNRNYSSVFFPKMKKKSISMIYLDIKKKLII